MSKWVDNCHQLQQGLTFAGVGAHHANGKAEQRIRELQELAHTQLIRANQRWPQAISAHLWPYALCHANYCINAAPNMQNIKHQSPPQIFTKTMVNINKKHWKPFGCPVYIWDESLQTGNPFNKWKQCARVGIYLGQSPIHNQNVALVLNQNTGHVGPQFHAKFDCCFQTVCQDQSDCTWQQSTFFVVAPLKHTIKQRQGKGAHLSEGAHKIPRLQSTDGLSNNVQSDPLQQQQLNEVPQQANDATPSEDTNAGTHS